MIGKRSIKRSIVLIGLMMFILICNVMGISANAPELRLTVTENQVQMGSSTDITLTLVNMNGAEDLTIVGLENFEYLDGGSSTSTKIINGVKSEERSLRLSLSPKKIGEFELIGQGTYKGKAYQSQPIKITVKEKDTTLEGVTEDIFVKTSLSKDQAYFGEKVVLTYELYTRYRTESYGFTEQVTPDGFVIKEIPREKLNENIVTIGGNQYKRADVKKLILTPTKLGEIQIPSYQLQVNVSTGDFFSRGRATYFKTDKVTVEVKPLPAMDKPNGYSGLIGDLKVTADYSDTNIDANGSISLNLRLEGDNNLDAVDRLYPDEMDDFTVYKTEKDLREDISGTDYHAIKEYEIILVPKKTGQLQIKPIKIPYFDTEVSIYKEALIPGTEVMVTGTMQSANNGGVADGSGAQHQVVINQIGTGVIDEDYIMIKRSQLIIASIIIFLLVILGVTISIIMARRGLSVHNKEIKALYKKIIKSKSDSDIYELLNEMLKEAYHINIKSMSQQEINNRINDKEAYDYVRDLLQIFDYRYVNKEIDCQEVKQKVKQLYSYMKKNNHHS